MPYSIHNPEYRARLEIRAKPYFVRLSPRIHLGYRKGKLLNRWVLRERNEGRYKTLTFKDVEPDDTLPADGVRVLDYQQVVQRIMNKPHTKLCCSFCSKKPDQVKQLVAGPGVFICNECVALCQIYMEHTKENEKLLIEDGQPVLRGGKPVFVPLSEEEKALQTQLRES